MGYFGNNFGDNWAYPVEAVVISSHGGSGQQTQRQPFSIFVFNTIKLGIIQEYRNNIHLLLYRDYQNSFYWSLSNFLKNPTLKLKQIILVPGGSFFLKNSVTSFNFYSRGISKTFTNSINLELKLLPELLANKIRKLKKLRNIMNLVKGVSTASEVSTVIFRTVGSTNERFDIDDECDDYDGQEWNVTDADRPELPLHFNCRCYWEDGETGDTLGQDLSDYDGGYNDQFIF